MKTKLMLTAIVSLMMVAPLSSAGEKVKVNWHEPENYTDVRATNGGNKKFRKAVFAQLEKHFEKTAQKVLPDGMTLKIKVTNLNLAGDVRYNFGVSQEIRLVKPIYWPQMDFEYQVLDKGNVIKSDSVKLRDMAFMDRLRVTSRNDSYRYEKALINEWFTDVIKPMLAQIEQQKTAIMS